MIDYLTHIDADTRRLIEIATQNDLSAPVPTCGEWTLGDLTWHMSEVQHFWGWIIEQRAPSPSDYTGPTRPTDDALVEFLETSREKLVASLPDADPAEECWSWASDQTVGFTFRRQAHEALIHRVDAEIAIGARSAIDATLADDGIDEILTVFHGEIPSWGSFSEEDAALTLRATDTSSSWVCRFGRMTGTSPDSGKTYDVDAISIDNTATSTGDIAAEAGSLDLWLWGRAEDVPLEITGDRGLAQRLRISTVDVTQ